jgi:hypothetical protein
MEYKTVNMEMPAEKREEMTETAMAGKPRYPYGLEIRLDNASLARLGLAELPEIGEKVVIHAIAEVSNISQHFSLRGEDEKNVALQITDLGLYPEEKENSDMEHFFYGEKQT